MKKSLQIVILLFITIQSYAQYGSISGTVSDQFGFLPGAKISIVGHDLIGSSDVNGEYKIKVKPGKYIVKADYLMYKSVELPVTVSFTNLDAKLNFLLVPGSSADENFSTGSRLTSKSLLETAVAVDIFTAEEIAQTNQVILAQVLQYLIPAFHSTPQTISDGTDHSDPIAVRGMGLDQLLILINGKRMHSSSLVNINGTVGRGQVGTDINTIPISSVERIEYLKDGAAAQYGSDAIAGVINIVLKQAGDILELTTEYHQTTEGDGVNEVIRSNYGTTFGNGGFLNVSGSVTQRGEVNRSGNYTGNVYVDNPSDADSIAKYSFFDKTGFDDKRVMEIGNGEMRDVSTFLNASIPIKNSKSEIYVFGGTNSRHGKSKGFYRFPVTPERVVSEIYPNGFSPEIHTQIADYQITSGLKTSKSGVLIDFSSSLQGNNFEIDVLNTNNASMGNTSPTEFYAGAFKFNQYITNLDFSKKFDSLPLIGVLNVSVGIEEILENYKIIEGEQASYFTSIIDTNGTGGAQLFPGFEPQNAINEIRNKSSYYIDLESFITDKLLFAAAIRKSSYGHNSDNNNLSWKLAGRYKLSQSTSIRSSYNTGFRAPSFHQAYFNNSSIQIIDGKSIKVGTFNNQSNVARELGIEELNPEKSENISFGFTTKMEEKLTLSVDAYIIDVDNRIVLSGRFSAEDYPQLNNQSVGSAQFFTNAVNTQTKGLDLLAKFSSKINNGILNISAGYNYSQNKVVKFNSVSKNYIGQEKLDFENDLFNREEISRLEVAHPLSKTIINAVYKVNKFTFLIRNTRFGSVSYIHPDDDDPKNWISNENTLFQPKESRDQIFTPKVLTDMSMSYKINNNFTWTLGGTNIFGVMPDEHKHSANISSGRFVYSRRVQQFGVRGASFFMRLKVSL